MMDLLRRGAIVLHHEDPDPAHQYEHAPGPSRTQWSSNYHILYLTYFVRNCKGANFMVFTADGLAIGMEDGGGWASRVKHTTGKMRKYDWEKTAEPHMDGLGGTNYWVRGKPHHVYHAPPHTNRILSETARALYRLQSRRKQRNFWN